MFWARASACVMGSQVVLVMGPARSSSGEPVVRALTEPVTAMDLRVGAVRWAERRRARLLDGGQLLVREGEMV